MSGRQGRMTGGNGRDPAVSRRGEEMVPKVYILLRDPQGGGVPSRGQREPDLGEVPRSQRHGAFPTVARCDPPVVQTGAWTLPRM